MDWPPCSALALAGVLLYGPVLAARVIQLTRALHTTAIPTTSRIAAAPRPTPSRRAALIASSPAQPFIRLAGP
ncbi:MULTISPECIES: hypothetical protein [Streptomyces]|uniref:hypothetical protein n=1 Tax=Streptomyces TaxID=1883 RepID=UPI00117C769A|nr:hypothetical protein [Streptomyces kasugaensis]